MSLRLLFYITTHLSNTHVLFLQNCWYNTRQPFSEFDIDFHFYITAERKIDTRILVNFPHTSTYVPNYGYGPGATSAMYNPSTRKLFKQYDWVIRLNPDVIIYNASSIIEYMKDPYAYGIFGNCKTKTYKKFPYIRTYTDKCKTGCTKRIIMTDFYAFRGWLNLSTTRINPHEISTEIDATMLFHDTVARGHDRWILPYNKDGSCRIRKYGEIVHEHSIYRCMTQ